MTERDEPAAQTLFGDTLLDETAKFGAVRACFEGFARSSCEKLIGAYLSMKVPTYSSSFSISNRAADELLLRAWRGTKRCITTDMEEKP